MLDNPARLREQGLDVIYDSFAPRRSTTHIDTSTKETNPSSTARPRSVWRAISAGGRHRQAGRSKLSGWDKPRASSGRDERTVTW